MPNLVYLIVILLLSLYGMKALFHPGLFTAHDIWHQVVRLYYYLQGVNDGQFPVYWIGQLANNFGYPLFFFSYPLPWMIGIFMGYLGFDIPSIIKGLFILSYILSGLCMYLLTSSILKDRLAGLLSAILYLFLPYHFLIIFVSASMGIAFVFAFLPLTCLGIHLLSRKPNIGIAVLGAGIAGLILSHVMHVVFSLPVILTFIAWEYKNSQIKKSFLVKLFLGLLLGGLISAFYLLPALYYNGATRVHQESGFYELYKRHFINFNQLIYSKWGFAPIVNNAKNGEISFQLGIAQWISVISILFLVIFRKLSKQYSLLGKFLITGFIICVLLMLDISKTIWEVTVGYVSLDYPFRFILPASFIASFFAGIALITLNRRIRIVYFIILVLIAFYTNRNHLNVNEYTNFPISTYLDIETEVTTNTFNEYLPIKADPKLLNKPWNEIVGQNLSVSNIKQTTNLLTFNVTVKKEQDVSLGQFYFPGQTLYLNNNASPYNADKEGRISFRIQQGDHLIAIKFHETLPIKIGKNFTLVGILILILLPFKKLAFNKS